MSKKEVCDIFDSEVSKEERLLAENKKLLSKGGKDKAKIIDERLKARKAHLAKLKKQKITKGSVKKGEKAPRNKTAKQTELADVQREIRELEGVKKELNEFFEQARQNEQFTKESEEKLKQIFEQLDESDKVDLRNKRHIKEAAMRIAEEPRSSIADGMVAWGEGSMLSSPSTWSLALVESAIVMPMLTGLGRGLIRLEKLLTGGKLGPAEIDLGSSMFGIEMKKREFIPAVKKTWEYLKDYSFLDGKKVRTGEFNFDRMSVTADNELVDAMELAFKDVLAAKDGLGVIDGMQKVLSNFYRLPRHMIQTADKLGGQLNYLGELATESHAWARREVDRPIYKHLTPAQKEAKISLLAEEQFKKPSRQLVETAKERARLYALTVKPQSELGQWITKTAGQYNIARFMTPFSKTMVNAVELVVFSDPLLQGLSKAPYVKKFAKKIGYPTFESLADQPQRLALMKAMSAASATVTTASLALHQQGRLTGDYVPGAKPKGWQPNSALINGRYYSFNRMGPLGAYMKMGVNLSETFDQAVYFGKTGEWEKSAYSLLGGAAKHGAILMTPHTFLQGIDFLTGLSGANKGTGVMGALREPDVKRFMQNMVTRQVPGLSFQRWLTRLTDGEAKHVGRVTVEDTNDFLRDTGRLIKKGIPFATSNNPPIRDMFGAAVGSGVPPTTFGRLFGSLYTVRMQDVEAPEIDRWFKRVGFYKNPYVYSKNESIMNKTLNLPRQRYAEEGERVDLEPNEYDFLVRASAGWKDTKTGERYYDNSYEYSVDIDQTSLEDQLNYQIKNDWPFIKDNFDALVTDNKELQYLGGLSRLRGSAHLMPHLQRYAFHKIYNEYKLMGKYYLKQKHGEDLSKRIDKKKADRERKDLQRLQEGVPTQSLNILRQESRTPATDLAGIDPIDGDEYMTDDEVAAAEEHYEQASRTLALKDGYYDPTSWYENGADMSETVYSGTGVVWDDDTKMAYKQEMDEEVLG